eukprot:gene219-229_t
MHIGPHKTGSTHIHSYLDKISEQLPSFNYCWPVPRGNIMNSNMLAIHFLSNHTTQNVSLQWLDNCVNTSQNIILSAEAFDRFTLDNFIEFRNYLRDFDFEIVIIYREWLNHMYSLYTEIHKHASKGTSFSEYLFKNFDLLQAIPILNVTRLISSYEPVVGIQNIHLLDYYGIIAARKDEAYVIVCEIMGILCHESEYLNNQKIKENERPDMIASQLFQIVRDQALLLGCKIANERRDYMIDLIRYYRDVNLSVPLAFSSLNLLHLHASVMDSSVREQFSSIIKYGNRSANIEALQRVNVTEVNRLAFFTDEDCVNWLVNEVKEQINMKRFHSCKKDIITREDVLNNINNQTSDLSSRRVPGIHESTKPRPSLKQRSQISTTPIAPSHSMDRRNISERILQLRKKASDANGVS